MKIKLTLAVMIGIGAAFQPAMAQPTKAATSTPATPFDSRIEQLIAVLNGQMELDTFFTPSFLAAIPPAQIKAISDSFTQQYGKALSVQSVQRSGSNNATLQVEYEKAIATIEITTEVSPPFKVAGLLAKGFAVKGDSIDKIKTDFGALSGTSGFVVQKLSDDGVATLHALNDNKQFATGSTFKLYVLAELASQVAGGQRRWSDVVPLGVRNHSSAGTQNWPLDTPVTLQTLATWMISVSDNAATDALMRELGRDAVEGKLATIGHSAPDKALPMLTTVEAFALKSNPALRQRFEKASEAGQRELLASERAALSYSAIDMSHLGSGPVAIDSVEWFASPADTALLLNNLRRSNSQTTRDIMAVNSGIGPAAAGKWRYLGYKGGSEPGVISMSFLTQSKAGDWYAISGSWNNPAKDIDNAQFVSLMTRLLDSVTGS
ncbi:serine hydrolase [Sphingorhabdus sp.]|uniref:serine hydrolase n=1 Tax=Sphingorhabdus sp. TaxID=1902408 RepID=UPI0032B88295